MTKHYADRDPQLLEPHYSNHVSAMTSEDLHSKSDIAAELAVRDLELEEAHKHLSLALSVIGVSNLNELTGKEANTPEQMRRAFIEVLTNDRLATLREIQTIIKQRDQLKPSYIISKQIRKLESSRSRLAQIEEQDDGKAR